MNNEKKVSVVEDELYQERSDKPMNNRGKVVVADDELYIRLLVKDILEPDYVVLEASNGEEAVIISRTQQPNLVLMDILMPKLDGYTACYAIKTDELTKEIPVVMLTGVGHELNKQLSQEMGAEGYITKPFNPEDLLDKVRQYASALCTAAS
jgi:two-component system alkaline phosphatase synthesis response regulator PhoP